MDKIKKEHEKRVAYYDLFSLALHQLDFFFFIFHQQIPYWTVSQ